MSLTVQEIKALPRTEEGIFDLTQVQKQENISNPYQAAGLVYPVYAAYETKENKKEGYPDIMAQMRVWNQRIKENSTLADAAEYLKMLLATLENISPEIYENYRELLDMFRCGVKQFLKSCYDEQAEAFTEAADATATAVFCETVRAACAKDLLLAEKYTMCLTYPSL